MLSSRFYEKMVKNKLARELDDIKEDLDKNGGQAEKESLAVTQMKRLPQLYGKIVFQLDRDGAAALEKELETLLPEAKGSLSDRVKAFLTMDAANFQARYDFFYTHIGPRIQLYDVEVGDVMTVQAFTKSGYMKSSNLKIYGIFQFRGLEKSDLAGAANLIDLMSFRELYGKMTDAQKSELKAIQEEVGVQEISRDNAEELLFGGGEDLVVESDNNAAIDEFAGVDLKGQNRRVDDVRYTQEELQQGLVLNIAVFLKDPAAIEAFINDVKGLDAGLQAVDWQEATGLVGQFVIVIRVILYTAIFIIFLVALVIINNAMVMAMMERVGEIGTMRAIGAHRWAILLMVVLETLALGLVAGGLGALGGAGLVLALGQLGVPAGNDVLVFLFGGPALYPTVGVGNLGIALVVILLVSLASALYPAWVALQVQPVVAMSRGR